MGAGAESETVPQRSSYKIRWSQLLGRTMEYRLAVATARVLCDRMAQISGACATLLFVSVATAQEVNGSLVANGKSAVLKYAVAQEIDSTTEKGYMDVIVVLSDRKLGAADARNIERLEAMTHKDGLVALVVKINPDAKIMSAEPLHPAFTTFVSSATFIRWKPTAYDEKRVAGRFWTDGTQSEFRQQWSYDVTFSVPITLDPAAKTLPKN